ncbi:MAG: AI-2E family transporter [Clostridia bacterium]|nr:AI-2E family transporter [Clostridia bacterium]
MLKNLKKPLLLVTCSAVICAVVFAIIFNSEKILGLLRGFLGIFMPVIIGFVIAFVLNVPMRGLEKLLTRLFSRAKRRPKARLLRLFSLVLTLLLLVLILFLICTLVFPALADSVSSLYALVMNKWPEWAAFLDDYGINTAKIGEWLTELDIKSLVSRLTNSAGFLISQAASAVTGLVASVVRFFLSIVVAIYVLMSKDELCRQARKILHAFAPEKTAAYLEHVAALFNDSYSKFLSGQLLEACLLGTLIFLVFTIFRVPYAALIGILTAVFALIPYLGAFASCAIGAFLVLLSAPEKFLLCVILYFVVQFVENQFIYPHVVGSAVGLNPLWTLVAVLVGGNLMGILGMLFFIPLVSIIITLLREHTNAALARKSLRESEPPPEAE